MALAELENLVRSGQLKREPPVVSDLITAAEAVRVALRAAGLPQEV